MCFDSKTSLLSFSIGLVSAIIIYNKGYPALGFFVFTYSLMQLSEYFVWKGIENTKIAIQKFGSNMAQRVLSVHSFVFILLIMYHYDKIELYPLLIVSFIILLLENTINWNNSLMKPGCGNGCRLKWGFGDLYGHQVILIFLVLYLSKIPNNTIIMWFFVISFLASLGLHVMASIPYKEAISTIWCLTAALSSPILASIV